MLSALSVPSVASNPKGRRGAIRVRRRLFPWFSPCLCTTNSSFLCGPRRFSMASQMPERPREEKDSKGKETVGFVPFGLRLEVCSPPLPLFVLILATWRLGEKHCGERPPYSPTRKTSRPASQQTMRGLLTSCWKSIFLTNCGAAILLCCLRHLILNPAVQPPHGLARGLCCQQFPPAAQFTLTC